MCNCGNPGIFRIVVVYPEEKETDDKREAKDDN